MRRLATWGGVIVVGVMVMGAEPAPPMPTTPRAMPPLPVPPVERQKMPPYLARITISGDPKTSGVVEECVDPAARHRSGQDLEARPADPPQSMTGCTTAYKMQPDHSVHHELSCDRAKGAKGSFRMVSDGTPDDVRMHMEREDVDPVTGVSKTTVVDSHMVRLGPCPADLKPGQTRRPGGPILDKSAAARLLESARGAGS